MISEKQADLTQLVGAALGKPPQHPHRWGVGWDPTPHMGVKPILESRLQIGYNVAYYYQTDGQNRMARPKA